LDADDVRIRILGNVAIIHGRSTDVWGATDVSRAMVAFAGAKAKRERLPNLRF
jgi:hypothetical protein